VRKGNRGAQSEGSNRQRFGKMSPRAKPRAIEWIISEVNGAGEPCDTAQAEKIFESCRRTGVFQKSWKDGTILWYGAHCNPLLIEEMLEVAIVERPKLKKDFYMERYGSMPNQPKHDAEHPELCGQVQYIIAMDAEHGEVTTVESATRKRHRIWNTDPCPWIQDKDTGEARGSRFVVHTPFPDMPRFTDGGTLLHDWLVANVDPDLSNADRKLRVAIELGEAIVMDDHDDNEVVGRNKEPIVRVKWNERLRAYSTFIASVPVDEEVEGGLDKMPALPEEEAIKWLIGVVGHEFDAGRMLREEAGAYLFKDNLWMGRYHEKIYDSEVRNKAYFKKQQEEEEARTKWQQDREKELIANGDGYEEFKRIVEERKLCRNHDGRLVNIRKLGPVDFLRDRHLGKRVSEMMGGGDGLEILDLAWQYYQLNKIGDTGKVCGADHEVAIEQRNSIKRTLAAMTP
jgi:hypothetical protein